MKLFSVSIGLLLAALGVFYIPVSFAVDGFGLVVNPGGVRTIRATEAGNVLHFASEGGRFFPGQIVTAVTRDAAVAENALLEGTMRREMARNESDHLERSSKLIVEIERDRAKLRATSELLAARNALKEDTASVLAALQSFTADSKSDIDDLNEERLSQLARLEDLLKRSEEISALPAQRLASMLEDVQGERLSVITSKGTRFSSEKMVLDMVKALNDLTYSNSIDQAEVEILTDRLDNLAMQLRELEALRSAMQVEAEARYLAKAMLPQVEVSNGVSVDMRTLQGSRADVEKGDALRLLATGEPVAGISILVFGAPTSGTVRLQHGASEIALALPANSDAIRDALTGAGLEVAEIHLDAQTVAATDITSIFIALAARPAERLSVVSSRAMDGRGVPVLVNTELTLPTDFGAELDEGAGNEIIGFLENRHAVVLQPGQRVRGAINDTRTGSEIVFDAILLDRDFATVDTRELGIRLGNASLADKIIKRGVLSQVVIGVEGASAEQIRHLPGAVVHLSFPLARQSLFSFLFARNASL